MLKRLVSIRDILLCHVPVRLVPPWRVSVLLIVTELKLPVIGQLLIASSSLVMRLCQWMLLHFSTMYTTWWNNAKSALTSCLLSDPPLFRVKDTVRVYYQTIHFIFYSKYKQTNSVAMHSPEGPVLVEIFVCYFKETWVMTGNAGPSMLMTSSPWCLTVKILP